MNFPMLCHSIQLHGSEPAALAHTLASGKVAMVRLRSKESAALLHDLRQSIMRSGQ